MDLNMDPLLQAPVSPVNPVKIAAASLEVKPDLNLLTQQQQMQMQPQQQQQPSPAAPSPQQQPGQQRAKRHQIAVACSRCRTRKSKCDGARPQCASCKARGCDCHYDVEPDATRAIAQKRRQEAMQRKLDQYQEVYQYLRERPPEEANGILQRIRDGWDVLELHHFIKEGELLLQVPPPGIPGLPSLGRNPSAGLDDAPDSPKFDAEPPA